MALTRYVFWLIRRAFRFHRPLTFRNRGPGHNKTRRSRHPNVKVYRSQGGDIRKVRIGRWRLISPKPLRPIVDVREIDSGQRVAVRFELIDPFSMAPVSTVWEYYKPNGRLESLLQSTDDSCLWLQTRCKTGADETSPLGDESSFQVPAWG